VLAPASAGEPHKDRCVIMVSVDGLAGFYLDDPKADLPTLRRLAREGARADGLVCSFPTVTWPNHTTLVTGVPPVKHGVIGNSYLDRKTATSVSLLPDPLFDKDEIVKSPTIYDAAHKAGLVTSGIIWPATRNARTLHWTVPDMFGDEAWPKYGTRQWLEELRADGLPVDRHGAWTKDSTGGGVYRDWLYTRLAAHVLKNHSPNLLLIHLVEVDHVEHRFGPRSPEAYWSVRYADDRLRDLLEAIKASKLADKTTLIVASDHGFFPIEKDIRPNAVLRQEGLLTDETKRAACVSQGGACMVYVLEDKDRAAVTARLRKSLAAVEGIEAVYASNEFAQLGQPTPEADPRAPDLWLTAKSGYSFTDASDAKEPVAPRKAPAGTHGYLPGHADLHGTLVLWGHGIRSAAKLGGVKLGMVQSLDVAPTIARLLGVELPTADGKAIKQAVTDGAH
jgi:predicted AlkP superfamily pyrophosphatase or phosphodiesterase